MSWSVVRTLPPSTTNMPGLGIIVRGSSFLSESPTARVMIFASQMEIFFDFSAIYITSESLSRLHQQVLDDGAETQGREEGQRADDDDHAHQKRREQRRCYGERA